MEFWLKLLGPRKYDYLAEILLSNLGVFFFLINFLSFFQSTFRILAIFLLKRRRKSKIKKSPEFDTTVPRLSYFLMRIVPPKYQPGVQFLTF